jgi:hypothetical protein
MPSISAPMCWLSGVTRKAVFSAVSMMRPVV